tara:strand:- start:252 stop:443 length:192 start_codon:yes stop_codon:yes gene_type:complete
MWYCFFTIGSVEKTKGSKIKGSNLLIDLKALDVFSEYKILKRATTKYTTNGVKFLNVFRLKLR